MRIHSLRAENIRNLRDLSLTPQSPFTVFSGDNGQGKTNVLEAIYLVATLRSFRTNRLSDCVTVDQPYTTLNARVETDVIVRDYQLQIQGNTRKALLDGKTVRPLRNYFGAFNVVVFTPDDLQLPRGAPADRRRFLDRAIFNAHPGYLEQAANYETVLKQRNRLLKQLQVGEIDQPKALTLLDVFDTQLVEYGSAVVMQRQAYLEALAPYFLTTHAEITHSAAGASWRYQSTLPPNAVTEAFATQLRAQRRIDIARATTSVGPHRDDLTFTLAGHVAADYASQGQLRALVLAWKIAEIALHTASNSHPPILLLDDVSSELDATRNGYLFEYLSHIGTQCFITTTDPAYVLLARDRQDFRIENGRLLSP